jgi:hypothetical protein
VWYALAVPAVLAGFWATRYWLAFRRVRALEAGLRRLGKPVGRSRFEVGNVLGSATRVPEPTADEELAIWIGEGRFALLRILTIYRRVEVRLRFQAGVCVSASEEGT